MTYVFKKNKQNSHLQRKRLSFYFYCCCNQEDFIAYMWPIFAKSYFPEKTFDIITCTVKITTNDLALRQRDTPIERHRGKLQNSFDIWIGKIMTKFISRYHCTSHQFSKTVPTVHNFSIWFLTVKSGLFFFQDYKIGK